LVARAAPGPFVTRRLDRAGCAGHRRNRSRWRRADRLEGGGLGRITGLLVLAPRREAVLRPVPDREPCERRHGTVPRDGRPRRRDRDLGRRGGHAGGGLRAWAGMGGA